MTQAWPVEIRLLKDRRTLQVSFDDGAAFSLPAELLRVTSPSAEVQGHSEAQRKHLGSDRLCRLVVASVADGNSGLGAIAGPCRAGGRACDFLRRAKHNLGKLRFDRDPLVADSQCGRAGAAVPCRCRQRGGPAAGWTC